MRIFSWIAAALLIALGGAAVAQQTGPSSGQAELEKGLGAYQAGQQEAALAALNHAATKGDPSTRFVAEFYLARIYAESGPAADHTKAFVLFRKLADENLNIDPETSKLAPFVAKSLIALAGYVRVGIKEIDLPPNSRRAIDYLHHAAVFFGDKDAQFELARAYLGADSTGDDIRRGLHYLSVLAEAGHPRAQAMLADLFWRGRHLKKDEPRALALITIAAQNAPAHERLWIEETHATIFCASGQTTRDAAGDLVARWSKTFARPAPEPPDRMGLAIPDLLPERHCASGEKVAISPSAPPVTAPTTSKADLKTAPPPSSAPSSITSSTSAGFRAAGILDAKTKK